MQGWTMPRSTSLPRELLSASRKLAGSDCLLKSQGYWYAQLHASVSIDLEFKVLIAGGCHFQGL